MIFNQTKSQFMRQLLSVGGGIARICGGSGSLTECNGLKELDHCVICVVNLVW